VDGDNEPELRGTLGSCNSVVTTSASAIESVFGPEGSLEGPCDGNIDEQTNLFERGFHISHGALLERYAASLQKPCKPSKGW
jgi:hypothetical protein